MKSSREENVIVHPGTLNDFGKSLGFNGFRFPHFSPRLQDDDDSDEFRTRRASSSSNVYNSLSSLV